MTIVGLVSAPLVTIVVPAYNVAKYLAPCLDSILAQSSWEDCRVIVVDDGSTDQTPQIAADYAARLPQIQVLRQPNAGPGAGAARNHGLDLVQTEFVMFLDGDDVLTPRGVELLRNGLLQTGLDLAVGATEQFPEPRTWIWTDYFSPGEGRAVDIESVPLLAHDARTCNKLYRTEWLRRQGLRFGEGIHHQDTLVNVPAMLLADEIFLVGDTVHRYRKRAEGGSVMDSHFTRVANYFDHLLVIEELNAMRARLAAGREPLLQAFIARSFQGFSWRAPEVLPLADLRGFFDRAAAVITTLDPDIIELATRGPSERTAYVTMLEGDFETFERLPEWAGQLTTHDGRFYLAVPAPHHRGLLECGPVRSYLTELVTAEAGITLRFRIRIRKAPGLPETLLSRANLMLLRDDLEPVTSKLSWIGSAGHTGLAETFLPWSKLETAAYQLRLQLRTASGSVGRWPRRPAAAEGADSPDSTTEYRCRQAGLSLATDAEQRIVLGVRLSLRTKLSRQRASWRKRLRSGG